MLPYLAHRKVRKRKSYYSSSYLLNYMMASGWGSEWWFIIFWQCQITAHPLVPGSSLCMSNTPRFAVTGSKAGNQWQALKAYFNGLTTHSTGSQNQKSGRQESHFSSASLVLACSLKHFLDCGFLLSTFFEVLYPIYYHHQSSVNTAVITSTEQCQELSFMKDIHFYPFVQPTTQNFKSLQEGNPRIWREKREVLEW